MAESQNNSSLPEVTPEVRTNLLKVLQSEPGEKPLSKEKFDEVRPFLDPIKGGLTRDAFQTLRDDKEVIQAATQSRAWGRLEIASLRESILKVLHAKPGEKVLSLDEFKETAGYLDRKNGGLRPSAFEVFKSDKEVLDAAIKHREAWASHKSEKTIDQSVEAKAEVKSESKPPITITKAEVLKQFLEKNAPGQSLEPSKESELER